jgi:serine/threonine protein phosphatase PrpC
MVFLSSSSSTRHVLSLLRRTSRGVGILSTLAAFNGVNTPGSACDSSQRPFSSSSSTPENRTSSGSTIPLAFIGETHYIPSPDKKNQGEDALYSARYSLGVADGVGGWSEARPPVDSGLYSRALLSASREYCDEAILRGESPNATRALEFAQKKVKLEGSSTACLVVAGRNGVIRVSNVGDSGLQIWRRNRLPGAALRVEEAAKLWEKKYEAEQQQHFFNCPFQLSNRNESDVPSSGLNEDVPVAVGDLIIAGTDGLWDNLGEAEVSSILARFEFEQCTRLARMSKVRYLEAIGAERAAAAASSGGGGGGGGLPSAQKELPLEKLKLLGLAPEVGVSNATFAAKEKECRSQLAAMASFLTTTAIRIGNDERAVTPFAKNAAKAGKRWEGGKLDDTAVVVALVIADDDVDIVNTQ